MFERFGWKATTTNYEWQLCEELDYEETMLEILEHYNH